MLRIASLLVTAEGSFCEISSPVPRECGDEPKLQALWIAAWLLSSTPAGRRRRLVALIVALVVFGLGGAALIESRHERADAARRAANKRHVPVDAATPADEAARADAAGRPDRADRAGVPELKPTWVSPMPNARTTSCFGKRWGVLHAGVDLAMPEDTPILAAGAGVVHDAGWLYTGYGNSVVIDHGGGVLTHYAHMNKTAVRKGQRVRPGDLIGYEGSTGDSTGPHLHFEVHIGALWKQVDPQPWMKARGVDLHC